MRVFSRRRVVAALAVMVTGGCAGDSASPVVVTQVVITPNILTIDELEGGVLTATAYQASGEVVSGRPVTWVSSRPERFTVSSQGQIQGIQFGEGTVTATVGGVSGSALVRVLEVPVASVSLAGPSEIRVGEIGSFLAQARAGGGLPLSGRAITFSVTRSAHAEVSGDGVVTGKLEGDVEVRASVGALTASQPLTITPERITEIRVTPESLTLPVGSTSTLVAVPIGLTGSELRNRPVTFTSLDPSVATVTPAGVVRGIADGATDVRVVSGDVEVLVAVAVGPAFPVTARVLQVSSDAPTPGVPVHDISSGSSVPFCTTGADGTCTGFVAPGSDLLLTCVDCVAEGGGSEVALPNVAAPATASFRVDVSVVFSETFDGSFATSGWKGQSGDVGRSSATYVEDPRNPSNSVITFGDMRAGGDAFSPPIPLIPGRRYRLSFDFLGTPGSAVTESDGFAGLSDGYPGRHVWLGTSDRASPDVPIQMIDDGHWRTYSIELEAGSHLPVTDGLFHVMLEDGDGGIPGDVFFDNVTVVVIN